MISKESLSSGTMEPCRGRISEPVEGVRNPQLKGRLQPSVARFPGGVQGFEAGPQGVLEPPRVLLHPRHLTGRPRLAGHVAEPAAGPDRGPPRLERLAPPARLGERATDPAVQPRRVRALPRASRSSRARPYQSAARCQSPSSVYAPPSDSSARPVAIGSFTERAASSAPR